MKKMLLIAAALFSTSAFALPDIDVESLQTLLATNPTATDGMSSRKVSELVANIMTSHFNSRGAGTLSVATNECILSQDVKTYACRLNILNSDRKIKRGAYVPAPGMTESSTSIDYTIDASTGEITGPVKYMQAG